MFTFAWGLYSSLFTDCTYKVLIIGLESSGKTTLVEQLKCMYPTKSNNNNNNNNKHHTSETGERGATCIPTPAPVNVMKSKRIRPTVGLNMDRITHRTTPVGVIGSSSSLSSKENTLHAKDSDNQTSTCSASVSSSAHIANTMTTSFTPATTRLTLWDVGGLMQTIWANYFAPCHGVIFLVDSTLGTMESGSTSGHLTKVAADSSDQAVSSSIQSNRSSMDCENMSATFPPSGVVTSLVAAPFAESERSDASTLQLMEERRRKTRREAYMRNAKVLREVFCHPHLTDAPLLILSNKADVADHCSLADMQETLGLVELALMQETYEGCRVNKDANGEGEFNSVSPGGDCDVDKSGGSSVLAAGHAPSLFTGGTSGIGNKVMRLLEVSALDGTGVRQAMDWLVLQMRESARVVTENDA